MIPVDNEISTSKAYQKVRLLDYMLSVLNEDTVREFFEQDQVMNKLKGEDESFIIIETLMHDRTTLQIEVNRLESEVYIMKQDMKILIEILSKPSYNYPYEFTNLKYRYGVF